MWWEWAWQIDEKGSKQTYASVGIAEKMKQGKG
jgi:hypothetical protein